jgi:hypothetical protein
MKQRFGALLGLLVALVLFVFAPSAKADFTQSLIGSGAVDGTTEFTGNNLQITSLILDSFSIIDLGQPLVTAGSNSSLLLTGSGAQPDLGPGTNAITTTFAGSENQLSFVLRIPALDPDQEIIVAVVDDATGLITDIFPFTASGSATFATPTDPFTTIVAQRDAITLLPTDWSSSSTTLEVVSGALISASAPEPGTLPLQALGVLVGLLARRRRRRHA